MILIIDYVQYKPPGDQQSLIVDHLQLGKSKLEYLTSLPILGSY